MQSISAHPHSWCPRSGFGEGSYLVWICCQVGVGSLVLPAGTCSDVCCAEVMEEQSGRCSWIFAEVGRLVVLLSVR